MAAPSSIGFRVEWSWRYDELAEWSEWSPTFCVGPFPYREIRARVVQEDPQASSGFSVNVDWQNPPQRFTNPDGTMQGPTPMGPEGC
jgi:hypothetical protein